MYVRYYTTKHSIDPTFDVESEFHVAQRSFYHLQVQNDVLFLKKHNFRNLQKSMRELLSELVSH